MADFFASSQDVQFIRSLTPAIMINRKIKAKVMTLSISRNIHQVAIQQFALYVLG
jgi:hypothetical protein